MRSVLYKYIKRDYLKSFFEGYIKIGTLYQYRKEEDLGSVIGDKGDGYHSTVMNSGKGLVIDLTEKTEEARFVKKSILKPENRNSDEKIVMGEGVKLQSIINSEDFYLYSVTSQFNIEAMKEFGYTACIEIYNPAGFFVEVNRV